jgi:hypothetical protein
MLLLIVWSTREKPSPSDPTQSVTHPLLYSLFWNKEILSNIFGLEPIQLTVREEEIFLIAHKTRSTVKHLGESYISLLRGIRKKKKHEAS